MNKMTRIMIVMLAAVLPQLMSAQKSSDPVGFLTYSLPSTTISLDVEAVQECLQQTL